MDNSSITSLDAAVTGVGALLSNALTDADAPGLTLTTDEALLDLVTEADRLVTVAEAARAHVIREIETRDAATSVAGCSLAEWLRREHAHTARRARVLVKDALRIGQFAELTNALGRGQLSTDQATVIAATLDELPDDLSTEQLQAATETMIEFAAAHDPVDLSRLGWHLLETIAPERAEEMIADQLEREEKRAAAKRGLRLYPDHHGSYLLRGQLTASEGEELAAVLNAHADSAWKKQADDPHPDNPTPLDQRLADALLAIIRAHQAHAQAPTHGGDRPRVTLILSLDSLRSGLGQMVLTGGTFLTAAEARRLACDCDLIPAVLNALGVPLDVGRSHRLVTPEIRTALAIRDRGCAFPGCDCPPTRCEAHHIIPWWVGGPTSLDNLVLLCPRHHRLVEPARGQHWNADNPTRWAIRLGPDALPEVIPPSGWDPQRRPRRHTRYSIMRH